MCRRWLMPYLRLITDCAFAQEIDKLCLNLIGVLQDTQGMREVLQNMPHVLRQDFRNNVRAAMVNGFDSLAITCARMP